MAAALPSAAAPPCCAGVGWALAEAVVVGVGSCCAPAPAGAGCGTALLVAGVALGT
jgi:hypothetical protein